LKCSFSISGKDAGGFVGFASRVQLFKNDASRSSMKAPAHTCRLPWRVLETLGGTREASLGREHSSNKLFADPFFVKPVETTPW
jgi:hypothetical protein